VRGFRRRFEERNLSREESREGSRSLHERDSGSFHRHENRFCRVRISTYLSLSRDLSSSMRLRRSSSRCSRKRCAASACCLSSSNFRCRSSFCLSRTSFALSNSFELPVDSRPANSPGNTFSFVALLAIYFASSLRSRLHSTRDERVSQCARLHEDAFRNLVCRAISV